MVISANRLYFKDFVAHQGVSSYVLLQHSINRAKGYYHPFSSFPKIKVADGNSLRIRIETSSTGRLSIPPLAVLPEGWSIDRDGLLEDFNNHFDNKAYAIPCPTPIAYERDNLVFLMDCDSQYFLYYAITDILARIDHPTDLGDLLEAMAMIDGDIKSKELDPLPDQREYSNTYGWSFDSESMQTLLHRVPAQEFRLGHLTPVMALRKKGILLFREDWKHHIWDQDWKYYIWDQKSIHRVDKPTMLEEVVRSLIYEGFPISENLKTTKLEKA